MKAVAAERRRFGYRRIHVMLQRQGIEMNLKKFDMPPRCLLDATKLGVIHLCRGSRHGNARLPNYIQRPEGRETSVAQPWINA